MSDRTRGFSPAGLARLHGLMAGHVDGGRAPGIITGLRRTHDGPGDDVGADASDDVGVDVAVDVIGHADLRRATPLARGSIFRITSMTKPMTAVAALMLVDDGRLQLDGPIDRLLPELAHCRVLRRLDGPLDDTEPAERPITLRDLLTLRAGFGLILASADRYPILQAEQQLGLNACGPPSPATTLEPDEWLRRLGTLPLMHQPGAHWMYNAGSLVLGILIARAARQPLADVLRERLFAPLGMNDTAFFVADADRARLVPCVEQAGAALVPFDDGDQWTRPPVFADGAAGLVSTVDDVLAFGQLLLDGGRAPRHLGDRRLVSTSLVQSMTTNQLTAEQRQHAGPILGGRGWGFGVAIDDDVHAGRFGWSGGYGTCWATDPALRLVAVQLTQVLLDSPQDGPLQDDFWRGLDAVTDRSPTSND